MKRKDLLREKISGLATLPTLPQVASRLLRIINDPGASAAQAAELTAQDVTLAARVLRLANSAFYGMPRSIGNLQQAVVILGFKTVTTIVVTLTVFDVFPQDKKKTLFDRTAFWRHCLACGIIMRMLAKPTTTNQMLVSPEEAFCAGMLHDIGKIVMEQYLHDDFRTALAYAEENRLWLYEAERVSIGYTHTDVAEWLTEQWGLPSALREPMIHHHHPEAAQQYRDVSWLCHYSDWLCYEMGLAVGAFAAPILRPQCAPQCAEDELAAIKRAVPRELENMSRLLKA